MKGNRPLGEMPLFVCFDGSISPSGTYDCINRTLTPVSDSAAIRNNIMLELIRGQDMVQEGTRQSSKWKADGQYGAQAE